MSVQLTLELAPPRRVPRQQPVIERLRAVLSRQGFNWRYRQSNGSTVLRPLLGARMGYEAVCGFYICGDRVIHRDAYLESPDWRQCTREDRAEREAWRAAKTASIYALWGAP